MGRTPQSLFDPDRRPPDIARESGIHEPGGRERNDMKKHERTPRNGVIYDFGMHNGDDVEYYLKKGRKIVGVEANPSLVALCADRFRSEIDKKG